MPNIGDDDKAVVNVYKFLEFILDTGNSIVQGD
jgi:hypothetical protein